MKGQDKPTFELLVVFGVYPKLLVDIEQKSIFGFCGPVVEELKGVLRKTSDVVVGHFAVEIIEDTCVMHTIVRVIGGNMNHWVLKSKSKLNVAIWGEIQKEVRKKQSESLLRGLMIDALWRHGTISLERAREMAYESRGC